MAESSTPINLTDISDAVKVIDYAAEQGAYRGWQNIRQILALRDRLDSFVTAATVEVNKMAPVLNDEAGRQSGPAVLAETRDI